MAAWLDPAALTATAAAAAVLLLPGLAVGLAMGLRALVLLGAAPPVSVVLVAVSAVVAGGLGVAWGPLVPAVATAAAVVAVLAHRALARWATSRSRTAEHLVPPALPPASAGPHPTAHPAPGPETPGARHRTALPRVGRWGWPLAGAAVGAGALAAQVLSAITTPATISQAYDVVFHVNAVAFIQETGDASSLHLRRVLGGGADGFYPAAWHGAASLVAALTGAGPVVATNALALVVAAGVWPLSVVLLADRATGSRATAAVTGVLAGALPAAPVALLDWGVLYPVLLAMALVPAVLGLLVALVAPRGADRPPAGVLVLLLGAGALAVVLAHPSGAFTLAVLGAPLLAWAAATALRRARASPAARPRAALAALAVAAVGALAVTVVVTDPTLAAVAAYTWPATARPPEAALAALVAAPPDGRAGNLLAAIAVVAGVLAVSRVRTAEPTAGRTVPPAAGLAPRPGGDASAGTRPPGAGWLVLAWLVAGVLYVVAQSTPSSLLTGPWYNDAYRLAPLVAVPALVLAAHGIVTVATVLLGRRHRSRGRRAAAPPPRAIGRPALAGALAGALAVAVVVAPGSGRERTTETLTAAYRQGPGGEAPLISQDEQRLFARAAAIVPEGTVIANDPFDGSGLSYALAGLRPLFPHMGSEWTPAGAVVKDHLTRVGTDPAVCAAVREEDVGYLFALGERYLDFVPRAAFFTRVQGAADTDAFEEVAREGDARLLRLVRCGGEPVGAGPGAAG